MKRALFLCILLFATAASGQQSTVTKVSPEDGLHHKEPIIVVDESTTPPTLITSWMSFTTAGESYVRTAWSQGNVWFPATLLEDTADPQKFLAPKTSADGTPLRGADGKLLTYKTSGDPFSAITTNNELYLVTVSCDGVSTCRDNKTAISLWKSINHGETWGLEKNLCAQEYPNPLGAPANDPCRQPGYADVDKPSIAVSNNSLYVAHLIFSRDGAFSPAIVVHQRANGTWTAKKFDASEPGSPIVVVADRVYVVWLSRELNLNRLYVTYSSDPNNPMLFDQREFIDIGGRFSTCLQDCRDSGSDCASLMDATSNLMARYNAQDQSIAIVWHATAATETQADMKFISFSTVTKHFVEASPVTVDWTAPGNQWTPGIDCGPYGGYGRCLITYYQSSQCSSNPSNPYSVKFHPHAILVDARGNTVGTGGWDITPDESDPKGYRPPGATKDTGMGEYQGVYYSAGKWYSAFLQVLTPMTGAVYAGELVPACTLTVSPTSVLPVPASGGSVHFDVTMTPEGCTSWTPAWALNPPPAWAAIDNAATRYTSGSFNVAVQANLGSQRQATLTVAGKSIVIPQQAQGCASLPRRVAVAPSLASKTDHPVLTTVPDSGSVLHYDWYERLPGETTPRLYYKHTWSITVTPSQPLTYYSAVVRNSCGDTVSLAEVPVYLCVPTIDSQPVDQFVPFGANASLSVAASPAIPGQPLTVTWWSYDTGQIVGSGPTFSFTPEPGTARTYYGYVGADCSGIPFTKQTNAVTVTAAPAPRDAQVLSQTVPTTMTALRSYTVSATLKNRGTESWSPVGPSPQCNVFRLGSPTLRTISHGEGCVRICL
ncbi:MAG TPA: hypothetical protein VH394_15695 [Thermoanaerobaculia bacterium]|jgi:hypothetical protein|nr:hypothetical protein [Thermoanaerobaculia bacterium]